MSVSGSSLSSDAIKFRQFNLTRRNEIKDVLYRGATMTEQEIKAIGEHRYDEVIIAKARLGQSSGYQACHASGWVFQIRLWVSFQYMELAILVSAQVQSD